MVRPDIMRAGTRACHRAVGLGEGALPERDTMKLELTGL